MRKDLIAILLGFCSVAPVLASNEGVPSYYQKNATSMNRAGYANYQNRGYQNYVGSGSKQVVSSNTYSYQVPSANQTPGYRGVMTKNGVARAASDENGFSVYGGYGRRFADFEFTTSVNSVLEWDDMQYNEFTVGGRYNFSLRNFDMIAFGDYTYGNMASGGLSMDYDLRPYDDLYPNEGIFTISIGDQSGDSHHMRFGIGARNVWDIGGWKLTPIIGYEIFKHNLQMHDHYYPNQGVYIPAMTTDGDYVFGIEDASGTYYTAVSVAEAQSFVDTYEDSVFQVCLSPNQIQLVNGNSLISGNLEFIVPNPPYADNEETPWGVYGGDCVVVGGDGPVIISGKTHEYNTTWSGFYIGLEIEKQMTLTDKLRLYGQIGMPKYSSEGIWPNRTDWQQSPSFLDEGDNGALAYQLEMEYQMKLSDRLSLSLKADTNYFHIGKIGGEIYWAPYTEYTYDEVEDSILATTYPGYTESVSDALKEATWRSFGLYLGVKYSF